MEKVQIFWDNIKKDYMGHIEYGTSGSTMYRKGNVVVYENHSFDSEDLRDYMYGETFSIGDYKKAIDELQRAGGCELKGPSGTLAMGLRGEVVDITFYGTPSPSTTPGGSSLSGLVRDICRLNKLFLELEKNPSGDFDSTCLFI